MVEYDASDDDAAEHSAPVEDAAEQMRLAEALAEQAARVTDQALKQLDDAGIHSSVSDVYEQAEFILLGPNKYICICATTTV